MLFSRGGVLYFSCSECGLVFMNPVNLPSLDVERQRYSEHNNDGADCGYIKHLMDIGARVARVVEQGASGLDYGCGPTTVMAEQLIALGLSCESYDPIFLADRALLRKQYDFVVSCEAVEHFHQPFTEFVKLYNMLNAGGVLGLKTSIIEEGIDLETWHYANDWTHVSFFRARTFEWLADRFCLTLLENDKGRVVFRKRDELGNVPVVAGLILKDGLYLVARRAEGAMAGKWEFPGGKLLDGESPLIALQRELLEELGMTISDGKIKGSLVFPVKLGKWIKLIFVQSTCTEAPTRLSAHSEWTWAEPVKCSELDLTPADAAFVDMYLTSA